MSERLLPIRLKVFTLWLREYVGLLEKDFCRQICMTPRKSNSSWYYQAAANRVKRRLEAAWEFRRYV